MKKKHLLILAGTLVITGVAFVSFFSNQKDCKYIPRDSKEVVAKKEIKGAMEWLNSRRADASGKIDLKDVESARSAAQAASNRKASAELAIEWQEMGPDNIGGRTRAILFHRDNPNVMYAGAVSGGLWRSTTGGQTWSRNELTMLDENDQPIEVMNVSCITQASNGDIYFGTGELNTANGSLSGLSGAGIWKSTDGLTFKRLASTWDETDDSQGIFVYVNALGTDPNNANRIYAATINGLRISEDAGATWNGIPNELILNTKVCRDLKVGSGGTIVASIDNETYISTDNAATFTHPVGSPELSGGYGSARLEFAISPTNDAYIYCQAAYSSGLDGIYQSTDTGSTWTTIMPGGHPGYQPTGTQGTYDNCIAVFPDNPEKVIVGGQLNMWIWEVGDLWKQVSSWSYEHSEELLYLFVHADQHAIVFHPEYGDANSSENSTLFIGTDGGIFKSAYSGLAYSARNKNYNVTQFYTITADGYGNVAGGTQDNGTQFTDFSGNTAMNFYEINDGDGGACAMSILDPRVTFSTVYYGSLKRSQEKGVRFDEVGSYFYNNYVLNRYFGGLESNIGDAHAANFVTQFKLWEHANDMNSYDSVTYKNVIQQIPFYEFDAYEDSIMNLFTSVSMDTTHFENSFGEKYVSVGLTIGAGEKLVATSQIYEHPIEFELPYTLYPDDEIRVQDPYQAMLAIPLTRVENNQWNIMLTRKPLHFNVDKEYQPWCKLLSDSLSEILAGGYNNFRDLEFSRDGNYLYFAFDRTEQTGPTNYVSYAEIYRISGLAQARTRGQLTADSAAYMLSVDKIKAWQGYEYQINGLAIDPNNPDRLMVTMSGFSSNVDKVFFCDNATSENPVFASKQGSLSEGLPFIPVFDGIINHTDGDKAMIVTELGVYATEDITAANPVWSSQNNGRLDEVVVPAIYQQTWENSWIPYVENEGMIYVGTHGRGVFKTDVWAAPVAIQEPGNEVASKTASLKVYPNPVVEYAEVEFNLSLSEDVSMMVFDLQGKMVEQKSLGTFAPGTHNVKVDFGGLESGTYFVNMKLGPVTKNTKVVVL